MVIKVDKWTLEELKVDFKRKNFVVPKFQRKFVWDRKKICELMDSIYKNFPIGSFLIWKTNLKDLFKSSGNLPESKPELQEVNYILDGQQRITSIYGILSKQILENIYGTKIECENICLDLEALEQYKNNKKELNEENLCIFQYRKPNNKRYFSLTDLLDDNKLDDICDSIDDKNTKKKLRECRRIFYDYPFPYCEIKEVDTDINSVCESFVRINSRGTRLNTANLVVAAAFRKNFDLQDEIDKFKSELLYGYSNINDEQVIQALALNLKDGFTKIVQLNLAKEIKEASLEDVKNNFEKIKNSMKLSIDLLNSNFGVKDLSFIPYPIMVSILSAFYYNLENRSPNSEQLQKIKRWFWHSALAEEGRYTGTGFHQKVLEDKRKLEKLAKGDLEVQFNYVNDIDIEKIIKTTLYRKSNIRAAFLCLLALQNPRHFKNAGNIGLDTISSVFNGRENHHIFPRDIVQKEGVKGSLIDSICNICFIPAELNKEILNKKPKDYFTEFKKNENFKEIMKSHLIPYNEDSAIWKNNYNQFIEQRAQIIKEEFMKTLGLEKGNTSTTILPKKEFTNRLKYIDTIKACKESIKIIDKYFNLNALSYLSEGINETIKEIKIISSPEYIDEKFKKMFKHFKEEYTNIDIQLRVITDKNILKEYHDRYIISPTKTMLLPSADVVARGQLSSITETEEIPFSYFWQKGHDILKEWNRIREKK